MAKSYIDFIKSGVFDKRPSWNIHAKKDGKLLGFIYYYKNWKQYIFYPDMDTVWNDGCLKDVINFLAKVNNESMHEGKQPK
jgi:hypothetical protein